MDFAIDIAMGMNYLHKIGVIHRDLKLGNVVLDECDRAKITDFGLSVIKSTSQTSMKLDECGTPQYMAPESFGLVPVFSTKSDVYAFSILLWELSHWTTAYYHVSVIEIKESIKDGDRLPISDNVSQIAKGIIEDCWNHSPRARPKFVQILERLKTPSDPIVLKEFAPTMWLSGNTKNLISVKDGGNTKKRYTMRRILISALLFLLLVGIGGGIGIFVFIKLSHSSIEDTSATSFTDSSTTSKVVTTANSDAGSSTAAVSLSSDSSQFHESSTAIERTATSALSSSLFTFSITTTSYTEITSRTTSTTALPVATVTTLIQDNLLLSKVYGIAIDESDIIYVILGRSPALPRIYSISSNSSASASPSLVADLTYDNQGTFSDNQGLCYLTNPFSRFAGSGAATGQFGAIHDGQNSSAVFCGATVCVADSAGNIYVSEACNAIRKVNQTGYVSTIKSGLTDFPFGLALDGKGKLLFSSWSPPVIYTVDLATNAGPVAILGNAAGSTHLDGQGLSSQLQSPDGLVFDKFGNLYIVETYGNCISKANTADYVTLIAGNITAFGYLDEVGSAAKFYKPRNLVIDTKGRLFVTDQLNNAVRMISW